MVDRLISWKKLVQDNGLVDSLLGNGSDKPIEQPGVSCSRRRAQWYGGTPVPEFQTLSETNISIPRPAK